MIEKQIQNRRLSKQVYRKWAGEMHALYGVCGESAKKPLAVIVAGQPGAGKGPLTEDLCRWFADNGGCVAIDVNELLNLHPDYCLLIEEDHRTAGKTVRGDALAVAEELFASAVESRRNLLIDTTLEGADRALDVVRLLHDSGYRTHVIALCVQPEISWESLGLRFDEQLAEMGVGRWVGEAAHDRGGTGLVASLSALESQGLLDDLDIITRDGERLLHSDRLSGFCPGSARRIFATTDAPPAIEEATPSPAKPEKPQDELDHPIERTITIAGGRKVILGDFTKKNRAMEPSVQPSGSSGGSDGVEEPRGVDDRTGAAPMAEVKGGEDAIESESHSRRPSARHEPPPAPTAPSERDPTEKELAAIEKRRALQEKLRRRGRTQQDPSDA